MLGCQLADDNTRFPESNPVIKPQTTVLGLPVLAKKRPGTWGHNGEDSLLGNVVREFLMRHSWGSLI